MNPIKLIIENFCGYAYSEISFADFSSILIVGKIRGNSKLSNGAGKSTIFNAIKYAIFNETDYSTIDKIIRHGTDLCRVSFEFSAIDGNIYKIVRTKTKTSDLRLFRQIGNNWEDITQLRNGETEEELRKIVKLNYKTFCNSVLFSQLDTSGLASLTPGNRKKILKEVLQLGIYSKYEIFAKKKTSDLEKEINEKRIILSTIGNPKQDIENIEKDIELVDTDLAIKNKTIIESVNKINDVKEKFAILSSKIIDKEKRVEEYYRAKNSLLIELQTSKALIIEYDKKLIASKIDDKKIALDIDNLKTQNIDLKNNIENKKPDILNVKHGEIFKELFEKKTVFSSLSNKLKELKIPMPDDSVCKHCRQNISSKSRIDCQKSIDLEITAIENKLQETNHIIKQLESYGKKLDEEITVSKNLERKIIDNEQKIKTKLKEIKAKKELGNEYSETLKRSSKRVLENEKAIEDLKRNINDGSKEQFIKDKNDKENQQKLIIQLERSIDQLRIELNSISNKKAVLNERVIQRTKDLGKIDEIKLVLTDLEKKLFLHQKVVQAFGSSGIPALITHSVLDDLQIESNLLLSKFRPGLQVQFFVEKERDDGDLADTLGINFLLDGFTLEYSQLSGAQKLIASLALKLGLTGVLKRKLGTDIKLLLIDEIDASIDSFGLELFEKAIKTLEKDYKILIITHNTELQSHFSKAILVEQDENSISTAKVVNAW